MGLITEEMECDSCRIKLGAAVMLNICDTLDCLNQKISCNDLLKDYKEGKITATEIVDKIYNLAKETNNQEALDITESIHKKVFPTKSK